MLIGKIGRTDLIEMLEITFTSEGRIAEEHRLASFWNLSSKPALGSKIT